MINVLHFEFLVSNGFLRDITRFCSSEEVFLDTQPLIRSVLDGFNVCIFAYGQTGSGKTFTMVSSTNVEYISMFS